MKLDDPHIRELLILARLANESIAALNFGRDDFPRRWELQTSNSFRRIGKWSDGDVLCAITQRSDGHPDLHARPHVLEYIAAADPDVVIALVTKISCLQNALSHLKRKIDGYDHVFETADALARGTDK